MDISVKMAGQPGSATTATTTASLVGNAFVNQYYNVLHQSPHVVHRFYTDQSKLSRAEAGMSADTVETQDRIREKIMSMDFGGIRAEIKTVDSQESLNGSVLVLVTGSLSSQNGPERDFMQTFFLAPQERGYFVLNDICRYLNGKVEPLAALANGTPELNTTLDVVDEGCADSPVPTEQEVLDYPGSEVEDRDYTDDYYEHVEEEGVFNAREVPAEVVTSSHQDAAVELPGEQLSPPVEEENSEGGAKMSYASILRAQSEVSRASFTACQAALFKATPAQNVPAQNVPVVSAASQVSQTAASTSMGPSNATGDSVTEIGGDAKSVYAKNLPLNITQEELEKEFQKFGSLKLGGVNLRNQKVGVCFAFIEFEDLSSAQSAIEASPISIGGRQIYVEEKRVSSAVGSLAGRGRPNQGRGYQADGMRGRGYFGGRGAGRGGGGGQDSERDLNSRGRGGRGRYGLGYSYVANNYGSTGNTVNGYRRTDNQNGNGPRSARGTAN